MVDLQIIQSKIYENRGQRVMLDRDLAELQVKNKEHLKKERPRIGFIRPGDWGG